MARTRPASKTRPARQALKRCSRCKRELARDQFPPNAALADGLGAYCRTCKRAAGRGAPAAVVAPEVLRPSKGTPSQNPKPTKKPRAKAAPGRPTKLTPELVEQLVKVLRRGHTRRAAAARARIDDSTLMRWLADGRDETAGPKRELYLAVCEAEGVGEYRLVETVRKGAKIDPQLAKWLLERRRPEDWARRELAAAGSDTKPLEMSVVRELICKRLEGLGDPAPPPVPDPPPAPPADAGPAPADGGGPA